DQRTVKTRSVGERHRQIGAERVECAVGEIDDAAEAEDEGKAERQEDVVGPDYETVEDLLDDDEEHGIEAVSTSPRRGEVGRAAAGWGSRSFSGNFYRIPLSLSLSPAGRGDLRSRLPREPGSFSSPTPPGTGGRITSRTSRRFPPWSAGSARAIHGPRAKLR